LLDRRRAAQSSAPRALSLPFLGALARHAARHPGRHLAFALFLLLLAAAGAHRYRFETDLTKVFNRKVPAVPAVERVQELFGVNPGPWLVVVDTIDEARRVTDAFRAHELFGSAESIASLIPADIDERRALLTQARAAADTQASFYEGLLPLVSEKEAESLQTLIKALRILPRALAVGPPTPETLPSSLKDAYLTPRGRYVVAAYSKQPNMDGHRQRVERQAAQSIHKEATGLGALLEAIMAAERPWALHVLFGIFAWVAVVLAIDLRRARYVLVSLVPVVLGVVVTFGALSWANVSFNLLTTLVVPLIIGLGVDSGIHVVHRVRERIDNSVDESASAVGRAMLMNTLTTCVGFAALMFTDHAGMESMGLVMLIGLPVCLWASLTTVPALIVTLGLTRDGS
jgi:predicted RND superfamily exporter protein